MPQGILRGNLCANFQSRVFCYDIRRQTCTVVSVGTPSSADRSTRTRNIPVTGGKFGACLTIVQMR